LPALTKDRHGYYKARHYGWSLEKTARLRSRIIASALLEFEPDLFVVDKLPRGIGNELNRSLRQLRRRGQTQCVLGLRDVLDDPQVAVREWREGLAEETIQEYFDELWIYGDRSVYDCVSEYGFSRAIAQRAHFTGYLNQRIRLAGSAGQLTATPSPLSHTPYALCVVGGGQDGFELAKAFVLAGVPDGWLGVVITGPFMPVAQRGQLLQLAGQAPNMRVVDHLVESDYYLQHAQRVVSMGGYNSVTAILSFGKPALIVPRTVPRTEQWVRARRLEQSGWVTTLHPELLGPEPIRDWLHNPVVRAPTQGCVDLNGLERIHSRVAALCQHSGAQETDESGAMEH